MASESPEDLGFLNFADEIYQVYRKRRRTALRHPEVTQTYFEIYGVVLEYSRLKLLPFIQFEKNSDRNKMIFLVVELDDVCTRIKCKYDHCKLLHTCDASDKLAPIYPTVNNDPDRMHKIKPQRLKIPHIRLIQRMKDIIGGSKPPMSIEAVQKRHKELFPNFETHQPTSFGISMRFKSTFSVRFDNHSGMDYVGYRTNPDFNYGNHGGNAYPNSNGNQSANRNHGAQSNPHHGANQHGNVSHSLQGRPTPFTAWRNAPNIIPYLPSKSYLSIKICPKWVDVTLIKDLVRHISQNTGKHVCDSSIENRTRLGFFTARKRGVAEKFVKAAKEKGFTCWGRKIYATLVAIPKSGQHQQIGTRVKIININSVMGERDFKHWVYQKTATDKNRDSICDIHVVFGRVECGSEEVIISVDSKEDARDIIKKLDKVKFRAFPLRFSMYKHPAAGKAGTTQRTQSNSTKLSNQKVVVNTRQITMTRSGTLNTSNPSNRSNPIKITNGNNVNNGQPPRHQTQSHANPQHQEQHQQSQDGVANGKHEQSPATVSGESAEVMHQMVRSPHSVRSRQSRHDSMQSHSVRSHSISTHSRGSALDSASGSRTETRTPSPRPSLDEELIRSLSECQMEMSSIKHQTDNTLTPRLVALSQCMVELQANNGALLALRENQIKFKDIQQEQKGIIREINANQALYDELMRKTESMTQEVAKQKWKRIIGQMTPENLSTIFSETMQQILETETRKDAESVIGRILHCAIRNRRVLDLYVSLCVMIRDHCIQLSQSMAVTTLTQSQSMAVTLWMALEPKGNDLTKTITAMMVNQTRSLFLRCSATLEGSAKFVGVMELIAELYNANLLRINLMYKGVLNVVLSKSTLQEVEVEGISRLLVKCGATLYPENRKLFEKCLKELIGHAAQFGDEHLRIGALIEKVKNMKLNSDLQLMSARYGQLEMRYLCKLKQSDMMLWDSEDVVNWILDLNPQKYAKYMNVLHKRTKSEGVDGNRLANLDKNNLHQLGIGEFQDVCDVHECIQDLVSKQEVNLHSQVFTGEADGGDKKECVICEGGKQQYACIPCGHLCVCKNCKEATVANSFCPLCRNPFESIVRIYT